MNDTCPRCRSVRRRNALSWPKSLKDDQTQVCSACSVGEYKRSKQGMDVWPGYPRQFNPTAFDPTVDNA